MLDHLFWYEVGRARGRARCRRAQKLARRRQQASFGEVAETTGVLFFLSLMVACQLTIWTLPGLAIYGVTAETL